MDQTESLPPTLVYYDGWCKACISSAKLFTKLDRQRNILICIDIRSDDPRIEQTQLDKAALTTSLHTLTSDGSLHAGPEAICQAMNALEKGAALSWTRWLIFRPIVDYGYRVFARNRLRWFATHNCKEGVCTIDPTNPTQNPPTDL